MDNSCQQYNLNQLFSTYDPQRPTAYARIRGGKIAPCIDGNVFFYQLEGGVYIKAYITGIPDTDQNGDITRFHGFHIHEKGDCKVGTEADPFPNTGGHFNPSESEHPFHAGDLPPILASDGIGILSVYTSYFTVADIINKSVVLHENNDDFTTQPAGNSGAKIACGKIVPYNY
ncbi:superoxide dismutase family protein [Intestinibacter bartlettii]|uniref:Superoxide dismutase family protein n=3 Tax=Intestinibacter bartlettii TaxID=261299 RepID=A0ABS6DTQ9_9FIRM|nr:superoxide dismutase family protein [Intestinibacter bartlettii]MBU5335212.1 superoxide dismutase family protein [Intestinibacter bartlettii]